MDLVQYFALGMMFVIYRPVFYLKDNFTNGRMTLRITASEITSYHSANNPVLRHFFLLHIQRLNCLAIP
ncbi:hypothetical protein D3C76_1598910 [compost metagenome]